MNYLIMTRFLNLRFFFTYTVTTIFDTKRKKSPLLDLTKISFRLIYIHLRLILIIIIIHTVHTFCTRTKLNNK